ncbi:MAG: hypothetical protein F6K39_44125 [Okeania sp. SIO3B3]|nr:hypothetical protein [Okeania sp. SIO3B3]
MSWGDSGSNATKQWSMNPKEALEEANYALGKLDPENNPDLRVRVGQVRAEGWEL